MICLYCDSLETAVNFIQRNLANIKSLQSAIIIPVEKNHKSKSSMLLLKTTNIKNANITEVESARQ